MREWRISPLDHLLCRETEICIWTMLRFLLSPRESQILIMKFGFEGDPMTHAQIAEHFGISRERVNQIVGRSLRVMRGEQPCRYRGIYAKTISRWLKGYSNYYLKLEPRFRMENGIEYGGILQSRRGSKIGGLAA